MSLRPGWTFRAACYVITSYSIHYTKLYDKGNPGVAANVTKIVGAVGYVDIADAMKNNMTFVALKNKAGKFVLPTQQTIADAAASYNFV